jgi:hypothetical protein
LPEPFGRRGAPAITRVDETIHQTVHAEATTSVAG